MIFKKCIEHWELKAARQCIFKEVSGAFDGSYINYHHYHVM